MNAIFNIIENLFTLVEQDRVDNATKVTLLGNDAPMVCVAVYRPVTKEFTINVRIPKGSLLLVNGFEVE
jgi:hypothetical protein